MPEQTRIPERQHSMRRADWSRIFFFDRMPLRTAGAGMCARRRSHFRSLRRKKVTKERATPLLVSPSLRCGATCGARRKAGSAQTRFAQTARGLDPLCACAPRHGQRGRGSRAAVRAIAALGTGLSKVRGADDAGIGVGSRFRAAKLVLRPQSRNGGRSAGSLPFLSEAAHSNSRR